MIHLSNSRGHTQGAQPFTKRRADGPVARPSQPTLSDEFRSAGQPGAGSPRRLEPANRSVNRPKPAHKHQSRPTHRNRRTAIARSSHPDQLRSPTIPKTNKTADPPTGGPRRPVGETGYRGRRIRRQSKNAGNAEMPVTGLTCCAREALRERSALPSQPRVPHRTPSRLSPAACWPIAGPLARPGR